MEIIGFLGKKRSGKNTATEYVCKKYGFKMDSLANPLKSACQILFNLSKDQTDGDLKDVIDPRWGLSPRRIMQFVGTEMFREKIQELIPCKDLFWWKLFEMRYEQMENKKVCISDIRFRNEIDEIHRIGGIVIKLTRNKSPKDDNHKSEREIEEIKNYDYSIENNGKVEDLYSAIDKILKENNIVGQKTF